MATCPFSATHVMHVASYDQSKHASSIRYITISVIIKWRVRCCYQNVTIFSFHIIFKKNESCPWRDRTVLVLYKKTTKTKTKKNKKKKHILQNFQFPILRRLYMSLCFLIYHSNISYPSLFL